MVPRRGRRGVHRPDVKAERLSYRPIVGESSRVCRVTLIGRCKITKVPRKTRDASLEVLMTIEAVTVDFVVAHRYTNRIK